MQRVIGELRDEGKTIIFSTHVMSEAERLCDRIAIVHRGRIHACDTLERLRAATGRHYLEDIFVHCVRTAGSTPHLVGLEKDTPPRQKALG
jgi:sodium transport system ATP-binding protein